MLSAATQQGIYIQLDVDENVLPHLWSMTCLTRLDFSRVAGGLIEAAMPKRRGNRITALCCVEKVHLSCGRKVRPTLRFVSNNSGTR